MAISPGYNTNTGIRHGNLGGAGQIIQSPVEIMVLAHLRSATIGTLAAAAMIEINGGSAVYHFTEMLQVQDYSATDQAETSNVGVKTIPLDKRITVAYEIESLDFAGMANSSALEATIATSLAISVSAYLDAEYIKAAREILTMANTKLNAKFSTGRTTQELDNAWYDLVDEASEIRGLIDKQHLGIDQDELVVITSERASKRFAKAQGTYATEGIAAVALGRIPFSKVGGYMIAEHTFIGKNIPAGSSFAKTKAFDFSIIEAILISPRAIAMPWNLREVVQLRNPINANWRWILKMQYGIGILRGELIRAIVNDQTGLPATYSPKAAAAAIEAEARAITQASKEVESGKKNRP